MLLERGLPGDLAALFGFWPQHLGEPLHDIESQLAEADGILERRLVRTFADPRLAHGCAIKATIIASATTPNETSWVAVSAAIIGSVPPSRARVW